MNDSIKLAEPLKQRDALQEIGISGPKRQSGLVTEEFLIQLQGTRAAKTYAEMRRNDAIVGAIVYAIETVIGSVDWLVEDAGETETDKKASEFLDSCREDMSHTWQDFVDDILTFISHGWSMFEMVYKLRKGPQSQRTYTGMTGSHQRAASSLYDDGLLGWRKFGFRSQEGLVTWKFDEHGGIEGMEHRSPSQSEVVFLPINKCVLFRTRHEGGNPEGYSMLRNAYRAWNFKKNIEWMEAVGVERDLVGLPIVTPPMGVNWKEGSTEKDEARLVAERVRVDEQSSILLPPPLGAEDHQKWHFDLMGSPGTKQYDTDKIINRYSNEIAVSILTQFIRFGMQGRAGTYNLARDARDLFHLSIVGILNAIEQTINRYSVRPLFELNASSFKGISGIPKLVHGEVGKADIKVLTDAISGLVEKGVLMPDERVEGFITSLLGLPEKPEGEKQVKPKQEPEKAKEFAELDIYDADDSWWPEETQFTEEEESETDWESDEPHLLKPKAFRIFGEKQTPLARVRKQIDKSSHAVEDLAFNLKEGRITPRQWTTSFQVELRDSVNKSLEVGQRRLTPKTRAIPRATRRKATGYMNNQLKYARNMIKEIPDISAAQLSHRSKLYMQSSEGLYHTIVKDGMAEDMVATWNLGEADHCVDCLTLDGTSWPVREIKFVPRDGNTECLSNCKCYLSYKKARGVV